MRNVILAIVNGIILSAVTGWHLTNWRFWVLAAWTGIVGLTFQQNKKEPNEQ